MGKVPIIEIEKTQNRNGESVVLVYDGGQVVYKAVANPEACNVRIGDSDCAFKKAVQIDTDDTEKTLEAIKRGIMRDYLFFVSKFDKMAGRYNDKNRSWPRVMLNDIVMPPSF